MIVREPGRDRWLVVDQAVVRNPRISHRARGILVLLLSMPDDWTVNSEWIAMHGSEGRDAVRTALTELQHAGHMIRHRSQDSKGHWSTRWVVYEQPVDRGVNNSTTEAGFPGVGFPGAIKSTENEVLIHQVTDMTTEKHHGLCATCNGIGRYVFCNPRDPTDDEVRKCHTCGGDGLGPIQ